MVKYYFGFSAIKTNIYHYFHLERSEISRKSTKSHILAFSNLQTAAIVHLLHIFLITKSKYQTDSSSGAKSTKRHTQTFGKATIFYNFLVLTLFFLLHIMWRNGVEQREKRFLSTSKPKTAQSNGERAKSVHLGKTEFHF